LVSDFVAMQANLADCGDAGVDRCLGDFVAMQANLADCGDAGVDRCIGGAW
jgi:hypothetical protein